MLLRFIQKKQIYHIAKSTRKKEEREGKGESERKKERAREKKSEINGKPKRFVYMREKW